MQQLHLCFKVALLLAYAANLGANANTIFKECADANNGRFMAREVAANNCRAYVYCDGSDSYADDCPRGTYFDAAQQQCALIWGDFECPPEMDVDAEESTTVKSSAAQTAYTAQAEEDKEHQEQQELAQQPTLTLSTRPICQRTHDVVFPHPLRCEYYYRCSAGYLSILRCNFSDSWDYVREQCVSKRQARCYTMAALETSEFK